MRGKIKMEMIKSKRSFELKEQKAHVSYESTEEFDCEEFLQYAEQLLNKTRQLERNIPPNIELRDFLRSEKLDARFKAANGYCNQVDVQEKHLKAQLELKKFIEDNIEAVQKIHFANVADKEKSNVAANAKEQI